MSRTKILIVDDSAVVRQVVAALLGECPDLEVISESLFGEGHRQIAFDIGSGNVWVRQVPPATELASAGGLTA